MVGDPPSPHPPPHQVEETMYALGLDLGIALATES